MVFTYTCVDFKKRIKTGEINASSKAEAIAILKEQGLTPVRLADQNEKTNKQGSIWDIEIDKKDIHKVKINKRKLLSIMDQMAIMLKAGVLLSFAMNIVIETQKDNVIKDILSEINEDLYAGIPLSFSMSKFDAFSNVFTNIISAGEASGHLDESFDRISKILEKEISLESKIRSALGYPIFLLGLTFVMVIVINIVVLPVFANMFAQFDSQLPPLTKGLIAFSSFLKNYWYFVILFIAAAAVGVKTSFNRSEKLSLRFDKFKFDIPLFGKFLISSYIARFCLIMSSMVGAGVDIVSSLEIARDVIPNRYFRNQLDGVIENIKGGNQINVSMAQHKVFDPLLTSMIRVGEETGMLYETLAKMSDLYEEQTQQRTKQLTAMMEPAMTIIIALVVGTVVLSVVIPMFNMYTIIH